MLLTTMYLVYSHKCIAISVLAKPMSCLEDESRHSVLTYCNKYIVSLAMRRALCLALSKSGLTRVDLY